MDTLLFRKPRLFILVVGMIIVLGVSSYFSIGRQEDPTITNLFATLITPYPGADPTRVEALVTKKLEDELKKISEIKEINSTSRTGISVVSIELSSFISKQQIEQSWSEIRDAISDARISMPNDVGNTLFDNDRTGAFTSISAITLDDQAQSQTSLGVALRYAKILQDRLRRVGGTDIVELFGEPTETVYVELDESQLIALNLTTADVVQAISRADSKIMAGRVQNNSTDILVEVEGEIKTLDRLKRVPLKSQINGQQIFLGDISDIVKNVEYPRAKLAYHNGKPAILVAAKMKPDLQVDRWTANVNRVLQAFENELPQDVVHRRLYSQNDYTQKRLSDVFTNMLMGIGLVIAVLFFTLGWRSAIVVAIVLPLTSLGSLTVLQFIGIPIHQMSVTGLIVALGLLVDAAIVITDDIGRRLSQGIQALDAVKKAVSRLKAPLLASTITTALAFTPMALLPGPAGDFVGSIAISVIVMLVVSLLLALTVTPALAGWLLTPEKRSAFSPQLFETLKERFAASIEWSTNHPKQAIFIAVLLPLMGFLTFPTLTAQFFPGVDRDQFYIQVEMSNGSSLHQTNEAVLAIDNILQSYSGITSHNWVVGENAPGFYYNMIRANDNDITFAEALVTTKSHRITEKIIPELQEQLDSKILSARVLVRGLVQGPPVNAPVELKIIGPDLNQLRRLGNELRQRMSDVDDIIHTRVTLSGGAPKLVFDLDETQVQQVGYRLTDVANILNASTAGAEAGSLLESTEELPIKVRFKQDHRSEQAHFSHLKLPIPSQHGNAISYTPISSLGETALVPSKSPILRLNGERINTVQGFIKHGLLPEEVLKQVQYILAKDPIVLPPGYRITTGGDSDARSETTGNLMSSMGLIIALSIATIVLTFNSYRLSAIAGIVCILSAGLSIFALSLFRFPFGIQALIGVIGSIGVSINAAIIILTSLQANEEASLGNKAAIKDVVLGSSRHIVSTTITTFGGFLPLLLAGGGFWPPFAMSIAGGVLLSTVISFYFTPPLFYLWYAKNKLATQREGNAELSELSIDQRIPETSSN